MTRHFITAALTVALAASALAQQAPAPAAAQATETDPAKVIVAKVNGQTISRARLDMLWNGIPEEIRAQYTTSGGGKRGFLNNYIMKRLIVQEAVELGFAKGKVPDEMAPEKEAALFDLYVREVIAPHIVTEAAMRKFYDEHPEEFAHPDRAKVRIILVSTEGRSEEEAKTIIQNLMRDLFTVKTTGGGNAPEMLLAAFEEAARQHSDHPTASTGGDLGWVTRDKLDPHFADAVFTMAPHTMSGIMKVKEGFQLVLVEDRQRPSNESYDTAREAIREYLLSMSSKKVMDAITAETKKLLEGGRVEVYADNVE